MTVDDLAARMREGAAALAGPGTSPGSSGAVPRRAAHGGPPAGERPSTSDLSIDEVLLLHSAGWDPVDLVCGVSLTAISGNPWQWSAGPIDSATVAMNTAFAHAREQITQDCLDVGGDGVVGTHVEVNVWRYHVEVALVGTAIHPRDGGRPATHGRRSAFVTDLSARDFCLLGQAGWEPVGLAFGASFVNAPRRTAGQAMAQRTQNVELTNYTQALQMARTTAISRLSSTAASLNARGVVAVVVREGPVRFASHAIGFTAWGTGVRPGADGHRYLRPQVVLPMRDAVVVFDAAALKGEG